MDTNKTARGETARRIYAVLHRNPDLTSAEIAERLPDLTLVAVQSALHKMKKRGAVEVRGTKHLPREGRGRKTTPLYHVKYKSGAVPKPKKVKVLGTAEAPKVDAELVRVLSAGRSNAQAEATWSVADIKPEPEGPKTPKAEREVLVLRHLTDIYKALTVMTDQQDALIAILKDTLLQLDATERELDRERQRRNWWDKIKEMF